MVRGATRSAPNNHLVQQHLSGPSKRARLGGHPLPPPAEGALRSRSPVRPGPAAEKARARRCGPAARRDKGPTLDLQLSSDQELFRSTTRRFLEDTSPLTTVRELAEHPEGFDRAWWRQGAELGWTSMLVPESAGGGSVSGEGLCDLSLVAEEMGRLVSPGPLVPTNVVAAALGASDNAAAFASVLEGLLSGEVIATWCQEEPGATWAPTQPGVAIRAEGDQLVVSGTKAPVEAADVAEYLLVTGTLEGGPVQLLVPSASTGVEITPRGSIDIVRHFSTVRFMDVAVPRSAIVTEGPGSAEAIEHQLAISAALQLAEVVGAIDRVLEFTIEWAFDRFAFGRALASYQALKHRFSDMRLWLEAARATTAAAVRAVDQGAPDANELVSVAKSYVGEHAPELVQDCVQMHGGIGVTWDHDIHLYLRRVTLLSALSGTVTDHRRRLAAMLAAA